MSGPDPSATPPPQRPRRSRRAAGAGAAGGANGPTRGADPGTPATGALAAAAPYERLAELAEAELAACETRPADLADLYAEAAALRASLPDRSPTEAEPALRRAAAAQERIARLLDARLAERGEDLERLHRARDAARAYATTAHARTSA